MRSSRTKPRRWIGSPAANSCHLELELEVLEHDITAEDGEPQRRDVEVGDVLLRAVEDERLDERLEHHGARAQQRADSVPAGGPHAISGGARRVSRTPSTGRAAPRATRKISGVITSARAAARAASACAPRRAGPGAQAERVERAAVVDGGVAAEEARPQGLASSARSPPRRRAVCTSALSSGSPRISCLSPVFSASIAPGTEPRASR